jgi:hypothetical protein
VEVTVRMRSRSGLHPCAGARCDTEILGSAREHALSRAPDGLRVTFATPVRVAGVLVDGSAPSAGAVTLRTPGGESYSPVPGDWGLGGAKMSRRTLLASELTVTGAPEAERLEVHVDCEIHALLDFARRERLDYQSLAYGRESFDTFHGYRLVNASAELPVEIGAVAISRQAGRFGNHLMQIVHATHVARTLGLGTVWIPPLPFFEAPEAGDGCGLVYRSYSSLHEISDIALYATFLFEDLEPRVLPLEGAARQRIVDRHAARLFSPPALGAARPPGHVAVHLRSGDLFDRPDPHPNFVQPPLAYYLEAIAHFRAQFDSVHVTLVYEDRGNPVITALRSSLEAAAIPCAVSSSSLADDLATLLEHRALVLGRGSFGVAVAALSSNVETLYFPWNEPRFHGLVVERGLRGHVVEERTPRYIEHGEWRNTDDQRRLMLAYPRDNLVVGDAAPGSSGV